MKSTKSIKMERIADTSEQKMNILTAVKRPYVSNDIFHNIKRGITAGAAVLALGAAGISLPQVADAQQSMFQQEEINGLMFIKNNGSELYGQSGTVTNPYQVWNGWRGSGFYWFQGMKLETMEAVNSESELNQYNNALFGSNLGFPYTLSNTGQPSSIIGTITTENGLKFPVDINLTSGFYSLASQQITVPNAYKDTIEGTLTVSCSDNDAQILPPTLMAELFNDPSLYQPNGCQNIPVGLQIPGVPIGFVSYHDTLELSIGIAGAFTISGVANFNNITDSTITFGVGSESKAITLSLPGTFYAAADVGGPGGSLILSLNGSISGNSALGTAYTQMIVSDNGAITSDCLTLAFVSLGKDVQCSNDSQVSIASGTVDTSQITHNGVYGSSTNPIALGNWLTSVGIDWYGKGYYTMPNNKSIYFNTGQDLVTDALVNGYTGIINTSQGTAETSPIQPGSNGTITWYGPGYYDITDKQANGGNPTGVYYISNQNFLIIYNQDVVAQGTTQTPTQQLSFITYDGNPVSGVSGSIYNPYPVWNGWRGSGYYWFQAKKDETSEPVPNIETLNQYNIQLNGSNLGYYTPPPSVSTSTGAGIVRIESVESPNQYYFVTGVNLIAPAGTVVCYFDKIPIYSANTQDPSDINGTYKYPLPFYRLAGDEFTVSSGDSSSTGNGAYYGLQMEDAVGMWNAATAPAF